MKRATQDAFSGAHEKAESSAKEAAAAIRLTLLGADAALETALRRELELSGKHWCVERHLHLGQQVGCPRTPQPGVLLVDGWTASGSEIKLLRKLQRPGSHPNALVLAERAEPPTVLAAVAAGARGYLRKPVRPAQVIGAVEEVRVGRPALCCEAVEALLEYLNPSTQKTPLGSLSGREHQIVDCFSRGLTDKEIATLLGLCAGTVHRHATRVFHKLGVHTRAEAASKLSALESGSAAF